MGSGFGDAKVTLLPPPGFRSLQAGFGSAVRIVGMQFQLGAVVPLKAVFGKAPPQSLGCARAVMVCKCGREGRLGSRNHRMVWVGRDQKDPNRSRGQGHLPPPQAAPSPVQPGLGHYQRCEPMVASFPKCHIPPLTRSLAYGEGIQLSPHCPGLCLLPWSSEDAIWSSEDTVRSSKDTMWSSKDTMWSSKDAIRSSEDAVWSSEDAIWSSKDAVQSSEDAVRSSEDTVQGSEDAVWSSENAIRSSEDAVRSSEDTARPPRTRRGRRERPSGSGSFSVIPSGIPRSRALE